jgi:hypothetical protein
MDQFYDFKTSEIEPKRIYAFDFNFNKAIIFLTILDALFDFKGEIKRLSFQDS